MLEHVEGYEEVTRVGSCLDSTGFQISGCAFKHGDALCRGVACDSSERADGEVRYVHSYGGRKTIRFLNLAWSSHVLATPMAHFYADHHCGYLYIWLEGGNPASSFVGGYWRLVAKKKVANEVAEV